VGEFTAPGRFSKTLKRTAEPSHGVIDPPCMRTRVTDAVGGSALGVAVTGAAGGYTRHATSQFAAAIAYRVLFSLVPLVSFVVAVADALLPDEQRDAIAGWLASVMPGQALDSSVREALTGSRVPPTIVGLVSLALLLWAASGMMAALRVAFRVIWENDRRRTFVESKLLDFLLVLGVGVLAVASLGATLIVHVLVELGRDLSRTLGAGADGRILAAITEVLASAALTYAVLFLLYRFVPPVRPPRRAVWLPALLATVGFHVATAVYGLYLARFGDVTAVYGPLGAVLGFLLVVYCGVTVILLGAELVAAWPAVSS
jgi:membrane protein